MGGASITDDEAKALFDKVKDPKGWPIDDDDLDGVVGGIGKVGKLTAKMSPIDTRLY